MRIIIEHIRESMDSFRPREIVCEDWEESAHYLVLKNAIDVDMNLPRKVIYISHRTIFQWYVLEESNGPGEELSRNRKRKLSE